MEKQQNVTEKHQNDEFHPPEFPVRVSNLPQDLRRAHLRQLFRSFGYITRVYVATDRFTGLCRGFAYVNFANKEDAEAAANELDGYGYENLIMRVQVAKPRAPRLPAQPKEELPASQPKASKN